MCDCGGEKSHNQALVMLQTIIGNATQPKAIEHIFHSGFDSVYCTAVCINLEACK